MQSVIHILHHSVDNVRGRISECRCGVEDVRARHTYTHTRNHKLYNLINTKQLYKYNINTNDISNNISIINIILIII